VLAKVMVEYPSAAQVRGFLGRLPIHVVASEATSVHSLAEVFSWWSTEEALSCRDDENDTPLHRAMLNQDAVAQFDLVKLILATCPDTIRLRGCGNALPLQMACKRAPVEVCRMLLERFQPDEADVKRTIEICRARHEDGAALWRLLDSTQLTHHLTGSNDKAGSRGRCTFGNLGHLDALLDRHALSRRQ